MPRDYVAEALGEVDEHGNRIKPRFAKKPAGNVQNRTVSGKTWFTERKLDWRTPIVTELTEPSDTEWSPPNKDGNRLDAFCFDGADQVLPTPCIIKNLVPFEGIGLIAGQSSAGKTFIAIHMARCLATDAAFFGHEISEQVGSVFVIGEGRSGFHNRLVAEKRFADIAETLPIAWLKEAPDFATPASIQKLIDELKAIDTHFREKFSIRLGMVFFDTVASLFSMKDENDAAEVGRVCRILTNIGKKTDSFMMPLHHFGKTLEAGPRGSSAWRGNVEMILAVLADVDPLTGKTSKRELAKAKVRDGEQGPIAPFSLDYVELSDGDASFGSLAVSPQLGGQSRFDRKASKISRSDRAMREAIAEVLDRQGEEVRLWEGGNTVLAADIGKVRAEFAKRYPVVSENDPDDDPKKAKRKQVNAQLEAFKRALKALPTEFLTRQIGERQWIARQVIQSMT